MKGKLKFSSEKASGLPFLPSKKAKKRLCQRHQFVFRRLKIVTKYFRSCRKMKLKAIFAIFIFFTDGDALIIKKQFLRLPPPLRSPPLHSNPRCHNLCDGHWHLNIVCRVALDD
jgi:hypothetical protein